MVEHGQQENDIEKTVLTKCEFLYGKYVFFYIAKRSYVKNLCSREVDKLI